MKINTSTKSLVERLCDLKIYASSVLSFIGSVCASRQSYHHHPKRGTRQSAHHTHVILKCFHLLYPKPLRSSKITAQWIMFALSRLWEIDDSSRRGGCVITQSSFEKARSGRTSWKSMTRILWSSDSERSRGIWRARNSSRYPADHAGTLSDTRQAQSNIRQGMPKALPLKSTRHQSTLVWFNKPKQRIDLCRIMSLKMKHTTRRPWDIFRAWRVNSAGPENIGCPRSRTSGKDQLLRSLSILDIPRMRRKKEVTVHPPCLVSPSVVCASYPCDAVAAKREGSVAMGKKRNWTLSQKNRDSQEKKAKREFWDVRQVRASMTTSHQRELERPQHRIHSKGGFPVSGHWNAPNEHELRPGPSRQHHLLQHPSTTE